MVDIYFNINFLNLIKQFSLEKIVYDIESYKNFFCCTCLNLENNDKQIFIIDEKINNYEQLKKFFFQKCFIGYNNKGYDDVIINYILTEKIMCPYKINDFSNLIIQTKDNYEEIKYYKYNNNYKSVDLMTHLFSKALRVGLKELEVSMNYENVQELPIAYDAILTEDEKQQIIEYNLNDVLATKMLAEKCKDSLKLREAIKQEFGLDCYSKDGVGIGKDLLSKLYCERLNLKYKDIKELRTYNQEIKFKDIISDRIKFSSKEFNNLLKTLINTNITTTKDALDYKILYKNVMFVYGTGGLHSKDGPAYIIPKDDEILQDLDISSLYPSILIEYGFKPAHLRPEFLEIYKQVRDDRIKAKKEGNKLISETYKLLLNSSYGLLLNSYSWLFDTKSAMGITINGQLFLTMLAEKLLDNSIQIVSINTDGITCLFKKSQLEQYYQICKEWEQLTKLEIEYTEYQKIFRRNVNTYFALLKNGKVKEKGEFLTTPVLGKGYNSFIIPIALKEYFINNIPIEKTIVSHKNIYNFCNMQKIDKKFKVVWNNKKQQRINRYYVSNKGAYLYKIDGQKTINMLSGWGVQIFNKFEYKENFEEYDVNYKYYISETNKILNEICPKQLNLF
jgi:hypothetical protein